jgi:hypothetical protein
MSQAREKNIEQNRDSDVIKLELDRGFHEAHQILVLRGSPRDFSFTRADIYQAQ